MQDSERQDGDAQQDRNGCQSSPDHPAEQMAYPSQLGRREILPWVMCAEALARLEIKAGSEPT